MDKEKEGYEKLFTAIETSYRKMTPFRALNQTLVEEYTGPTYGHSSKRDKHLNKLHQAVDAYTMLLAANRPKVLINTHEPKLRGFARQFQLAVNNLITEIGLEITIRRWILDAFFTVGIVKVHLADAGLVEIETDRWMDPGTPFASNVSLDNFLMDMSATKFSETKYLGDMYRIPFTDLEEGGKNGTYYPKALKDVTPTSKQGDMSEERLEAISKGWETDEDEFEPMVDLADVWVPREGVIHTFVVKNRGLGQLGGDPIATIEWAGPELGPYHLLGFNDVPDNIMPIGPASQLVALDRTINSIMNKEARRAKASKKNIVYTPAGQEDAARLLRSQDLEMIRVDDTSAINTIEQGGVNRESQAFLQSLFEMFDQQAGNLTSLLGLGAQADTASQERMIHDAGSRKGSQMQYRVLDATRRLIRDLDFLLWEDSFKVLTAQDSIEGAPDLVHDATWTPDDREGNFLDYNLDINIYSMAYQSPSQRAQGLTQLLTQVYLPAQEMLAQQGGTVDFQQLTKMYAELMDLPRLNEIVRFGEEIPIKEAKSGLDPGGPMRPANTERTHIRKNISTGGTPAARGSMEKQAWLGQSGNQDQQAMMARPHA